MSKAEDILRRANDYLGEVKYPCAKLTRSARPACQHVPAKTATASQLLKAPPHYFSTLSVSLDKLIGCYVSGYTPPTALNLKGKGREREDTGSIRPGAVLEVSSPPGGGKTSAIIGMALSARLLEGDEGPPEVLLIGKHECIYAGGVLTGRHGRFDLRGPSPMCGRISWRRRSASLHRLVADSSESMLEGIHYMRVGTQLQMITVLDMLDSWLADHPKVCFLA